MTKMTGMRKTLIILDRLQNGSTLSTTMVRGPSASMLPRQSHLTESLPPEHYFDREAESNDPSFLRQSLTSLWNPSAEGVKIV